MKKLILIIAAVALMGNFASAQENKPDSRESLSFGVKIGANYSNVYDTKGDELNADSKFGLATGAFAAIPIGKYLGLQPEILFSQKGFKATGNILGSPYDFTRTTSYIDVPLLFAVKPSQLLTFLAGPQYSYMIKQNDVFNSASMTIQQEQEFNNDNIRKNTLSVTGGIDFNMDKIIIGTRAGWDLQENNGDGTSTTPRYKNVWYQATLGYKF